MVDTTSPNGGAHTTSVRSLKISLRPEYSFNRAVYKSMGYSDDDLSRPMIGICNSWSTLVPGHFNLRLLSEHIKRGIYRAGATAVEFGLIGPCDGIAQGHNGMHYILPARDLIANDIEVMAQAHQLDALVLLGSCDKTVPGMLMAAARLDLPAILLPGGPMLSGPLFDKRKADLTSISEALGMLKTKRISEAEYNNLEELCCPSCGSCSFLGTANTMCCLSEALGMTLPGAALIPATNPDRLRTAEKTGLAICRLVERNITARQIITKASIENAIRICTGISGSTNAVLHLSAIAHEAGLHMDVVQRFDDLGHRTPQLTRINPAGPWDMEDFWKAGGIPRVMLEMKSLLDINCMTCTGESIGRNLHSYQFRFESRPDIVRSLENPIGFSGGIAVLRGNIAPQTGISKPGAIDPSLRRFTGRARCFDCEEAAEAAILAGKVQRGDVLVIRYEGPKGGPGMREMFKAMKYLYGMGLADQTAVITDGRFSGTNNGCFVGHISPEAAEGGPISLLEDGDTITIDIDKGCLDADISEDTFIVRRARWVAPQPKFVCGYLALYSKLASSAAEGAILELRDGK